MDSARWKLAKQLFHEALEREPSQRGDYLAAACGTDPTLRACVESLLAAHDDAGDFLSAPTLGERRAAEIPRDVFERFQRALAGRFSLERELGHGGMAIVYLARDMALDRPVAIKLLPPRLAQDVAYRVRFLQEARTAAGLSHPNIVPIHLVEEQEGLVYFVMGFVDGESLGERVRRTGPLKPADVARLMQEVAWALGYAHGRGVVHRDIKPDNILIDKGSGRALVTDFGIARVSGTGTMSRQGEVLGTVAYMSPEQANADAAIDGRSDLYSLGVTAFSALTGRLPFDSKDSGALMTLHATEPAPPVRSVSADVPARLAEAVDRCLVKDPANRFPSGEALAEAIEAAQLTRVEVAPSVRELLGASKNGAAQVALLGAAWMGLGVSGVAETIGGSGLTVLLAAVTPLILIHPFLVARGVVRAGLDQEDVAAAVAALSTTRDANIEYELDRANQLSKRFSRIWTRAFFFVAAAGTAVVVVGGGVPALFRAGASVRGLGILIYILLMGGVEAFFLGLAITPQRTVAILTRGTAENASFLARLWRGPLGRWFFKLSGLGLKARAVPPPESAPTEVLLGRAAGELFEELPKESRERIGDVQEVIKRLERAATALRARRDSLDQALSEAGPSAGSARRADVVAQLETARDAIASRLARAVGALENLRLDLLRLRAGVGHPDDLTEVIEEARAVGEAVDVELVAREEVESSMRQNPSTTSLPY